MANLKITINGVDYEVQTDGLASESTLQSLVKTLKGMSPIPSANANPALITGAIGTAARAAAARTAAAELGTIGAAATRQAAAIAAATKAADFLSSKFGIVGKLLGNFGLGIATKYPGLVTALQAMSAGLNIVTGVFSVLASVVGFVTGAIKAVYKSMNELLGSIKDLYASGARYQGNFVQLAVIAGRAGVGIDDFVKFLAKNQMEVYRFGDSLISGASRMKDITKAMFKTGWSIGNLGLSAGDALQYLANYSEVIQYTTKQNLANVKAGETVEQANFRVSEQTKRYILNLDSLARITGKTRDEMNQLALEISKDPRTNATLDQLNLSSEQLASANTILSSLKGMEGVGDNLYTAVLDIMQTGTIVNQEAAQAIAQGAPELQQALFNLASSIKEGTADPQQSILQFRQALAASESSLSQFNDATVGMVPGVLGLQKAARQSAAAMASLKDEAARRGMSVDAYMKQQDDLANATVAANKALQALSNIPQTILSKLFTSKNFVAFWNRIFGETGILSKITDKIYNLVDDPNMSITKFLKTAWSVISEEGVELFGLIKDVFVYLKDMVTYFFETTVQRAIGNVLNNVKKGLGDSLIKAADRAENREQTKKDAAAEAERNQETNRKITQAQTDVQAAQKSGDPEAIARATSAAVALQIKSGQNTGLQQAADRALQSEKELNSAQALEDVTPYSFGDYLGKALNGILIAPLFFKGLRYQTDTQEALIRAQQNFDESQEAYETARVAAGKPKTLTPEMIDSLTKRFTPFIDDQRDVAMYLQYIGQSMAKIQELERNGKLTKEDQSLKIDLAQQQEWLARLTGTAFYKLLPLSGGPKGLSGPLPTVQPTGPQTESSGLPTSSAFPEQVRTPTQSSEAADSLKRTADASSSTSRTMEELLAVNKDQLKASTDMNQQIRIRNEMDMRRNSNNTTTQNPYFGLGIGYPINAA